MAGGAAQVTAAGIDGLEIIRKREARRMKLTVDPRSGAVRLVLPLRAALGPAMDWVEAHRGWIERQRARLPDPWPIVPGMAVPFAGKDFVLDWSDAHPRKPAFLGDRLTIGGPQDVMASRLLRWLRAEAKAVLDAETREIAGAAKIDVADISVGDPRARWGSCSSNGNIRYSWRLILMPDHARRSIVAHEVAHRVHMDHSRAFHRLVAELYGEDPRAARGWLRAHGARLHWFGRD
jgi:predicted metal-dependent hydrolase